MFFDPLYWIVIGAGMLMSLWANRLVKSRFRKYSQIPTRSQMTGAQVAESILRDNQITDVRVEPVRGSLTDHFDPKTKTLRLSEPVFNSNSMAAFGIAAHEVGHAIQHAQGYAPLRFRSAWVPVASTGGGVSMFVIIAAFFLGGTATAFGTLAAWLGIGLFAATTVFTLVTLPVEFDASRRALACLDGRYVSDAERAGAKQVLDAAAMTYVAAFATSLMTLVYWAMQLGLLGGGDD